MQRKSLAQKMQDAKPDTTNDEKPDTPTEDVEDAETVGDIALEYLDLLDAFPATTGSLTC